MWVALKVRLKPSYGRETVGEDFMAYCVKSAGHTFAFPHKQQAFSTGAAMLDNHLHFGNALDIDPRKVLWRRVIDMNDRSLRNVVSGLGGSAHGVPRETGFDITAASEVMAMLCLAKDADDMRDRIDRTLVAYNKQGEAVTAGQLGATGAMMALLRDALMPNLVQTQEGTPALVHGGPFANIAHGCNSVVATKMAMHLADWTVTEAGFGFDLGGEKFMNIKCASAGVQPNAVVLVGTLRALKMHGGVPKSELDAPNPEAVEAGWCNLQKHIENARSFGQVPIVAMNRFASDTDAELDVVTRICTEQRIPVAVVDHFARGGVGALPLARAVVEHATDTPAPVKRTYDWDASIPEKINAIATQVYGASGVDFTPKAKKAIAEAERLGYDTLPICMAKTQNSISDNPARLGRPTDFRVTVREIQLNTGAGFVVALTGDILRMPGLPRRERAQDIDLVDGRIIGVGGE
jgi:formate--tetrahydrofolate ligase